MGSTLDSAYWVCKRCCRQFDWSDDHDCEPPKVLRPIKFMTAAGLDRQMFCTFRLGPMKRLRLGETVSIVVKGEGEIGTAYVSDKYTGRIKAVIRTFGRLHHLEDQPMQRGMIQRRYDSLRKLYGPHKVNEDSIITAITLRRIR